MLKYDTSFSKEKQWVGYQSLHSEVRVQWVNEKLPTNTIDGWFLAPLDETL